jgi:hypothetical protein
VPIFSVVALGKPLWFQTAMAKHLNFSYVFCRIGNYNCGKFTSVWAGFNAQGQKTFGHRIGNAENKGFTFASFQGLAANVFHEVSRAAGPR